MTRRRLRREQLAKWVEETRRSPLAWILVATFVLRVIGIGWGLPSSDAWDVDGIAPRDFLPGVVETFTPGHYFTYPPAHLLLLTVLTSPATAIVLVKARSLAPPDIVAEALKIPYMTFYAVVARLVSATMSVGIVWSIAKLVEEVRGRRAGLFAAAVASSNVVLTYYAHTTNLDVPCLFWGSLALLALTRAIARAEPRRLRHFGAFAALAIATKDQGYALFALSVPIALVAFAVRDPWPRANARVSLKELAVGAAIGLALLLVIDGVLLNPSGFRARVAFLTGPASQPYAYYSADWNGRLRAAEDSILRFTNFYPLAFAPLVLLGIAIAGFAPRPGEAPRKRVAALVPFLAAASFTLVFNCVARRTEERFTLPAMVMWSAYAGIAFEAICFAKPPALRYAARAFTAGAFGWALFRCAAVDANLILDPRYDAESWLEANAATGDVVEVHGATVYLPRIPSKTRVLHVGTDPVERRNPIYGAEEVVAPLGDIAKRNPKYVVVATSYAAHFLDAVPLGGPQTGRIRSGKQLETSSGDDATFFRALFGGELGYRVAHLATFPSTFWPRIDIHGSISRDVVIFERAAAPR